MKKIKYAVLGFMDVFNPETEVVEQKESIAYCIIDYSAEAEEAVKQEAYNGEYEIVDDGVEEVITPTTEERVEALEAAVIMLCMPDASEV